MKRLILLLVLLGCGLLGPTTDFVNRRPMEALPEYRGWYDEVSVCYELPHTQLFKDIEWFIADEIVFKGDEAAGIWKGDTITLNKRYIHSSRVVKNEILHYIRQVGGHPAVFDRCT